MRTVIRCPSCFTYVYDDARACHGCGERIGRRKILTRGSWIFIGLAVSVFTIARGIDLEQDKHNRFYREAEAQQRTQAAERFLYVWLTNDPALSDLAGNEAYLGELARLHARYPSALPADDVIGPIRYSDTAFQDHYQYERGKEVLHRARGVVDSSAAGRASCIPKSRSNTPFRRVPRGWTVRTLEFEAEIKKGDAHFTIYGDLCLEEDRVCCVTIDKVVGIEGVVKPDG
jgi:hypothetical protein